METIKELENITKRINDIVEGIEKNSYDRGYNDGYNQCIKNIKEYCVKTIKGEINKDGK